MPDLKIDFDRQQELDKSMTYIIIDALRTREVLERFLKNK